MSSTEQNGQSSKVGITVSAKTGSSDEDEPLGTENTHFSKYELLAEYGILKDLHNFFDAYLKSNSLFFSTFCELYANHKLTHLFGGKFTAGELMETSEYMLTYASEYIAPQINDKLQPYKVRTNDEDNLKSREIDSSRLKKIVFGCYLTFMLYNSQPSHYVASIHVQVIQLQEIQRIMKEVLPKYEMYEAMYCLYCLLEGNAFVMVPFGREYTFRLSSNRAIKGDGSDNSLITSGSEVATTSSAILKHDPLASKMNLIHSRYEQLKSSLNLNTLRPLSINPVDLLGKRDIKNENPI